MFYGWHEFVKEIWFPRKHIYETLLITFSFSWLLFSVARHPTNLICEFYRLKTGKSFMEKIDFSTPHHYIIETGNFDAVDDVESSHNSIVEWTSSSSTIRSCATHPESQTSEWEMRKSARKKNPKISSFVILKHENLHSLCAIKLIFLSFFCKRMNESISSRICSIIELEVKTENTTKYNTRPMMSEAIYARCRVHSFSSFLRKP